MKNIISLTLAYSRNPEQSEDAEPLLSSKKNSLWLGVFDGLGGSGAETYNVDGKARTGAYLASRIAARVASEIIDAKNTNYLRSFQEQIADALKHEYKQLEEPTKLFGKVLKKFPTTLAIVQVTNVTSSNPWVNAFWAGDSRVFYITSNSGMKQVTKDHIVGNSDAQSNLRDDSPMSNCASASDAFFVDGMQLSFHMPLIVVAATDGCYDYVETPAQFEYILLSTMARAECEQTWKLLLISEFQKIAGDDCTMALAGFGWSSFIQMQNAYAHRLKYLEEMLKPLDALNRKIHELEQYKIEKTTCINNIWTEYKKSYEVHHLNKNQRWPT